MGAAGLGFRAAHQLSMTERGGSLVECRSSRRASILGSSIILLVYNILLYGGSDDSIICRRPYPATPDLSRQLVEMGKKKVAGTATGSKAAAKAAKKAKAAAKVERKETKKAKAASAKEKGNGKGKGKGKREEEEDQDLEGILAQVHISNSRYSLSNPSTDAARLGARSYSNRRDFCRATKQARERDIDALSLGVSSLVHRGRILQ